MKHIFLNLKRFDIPVSLNGVNRLSPPASYGAAVMEGTQDALDAYRGMADFTVFLPEAHLLGAAAARKAGSPMAIGCQGVFREDTAENGNFGAFTTNRPAACAKALGCEAVIIGHCEERRDLAGVLAEAGVTGEAASAAVNRILRQEVRCARARGLKVLYCVGETAKEQERWQEVLKNQLDAGLDAGVVVGYEPVWSIGPGKTPADRPYITRAARFIKEVTGGLDVVYGGGLKRDNAAMLASIPEVDGGLIALTRFSGEIGFYPGEYLEIVKLYLEGCGE